MKGKRGNTLLDFDINNIRKNKIELLDCQIDLILRSLEFYSYTYKFIYPRAGKSLTNEENLRISLVNDTYEQIMNEFGISKQNNKISNDFEKNLKKFA